LRVLFVSEVWERYGSGKSLRNMVEALATMGIEPIIIAQQDDVLASFAKSHGFEYHIIKHPAFYCGASEVGWKRLLQTVYWKSTCPIDNIKLNRAIKKAGEHIDFNSVDLIHTNLNRYHFGALLAEKYGIPHIWHIREFGELDYRCISIMPNYINFMNAHTDRFIAISEAVKNYWINKGIDAKKVTMIYNGVPKIEKKSINSMDDRVHFVFTGSIGETKGQKQMVKAVAGLPDEYKNKIRVDFYGTGKEKHIEEMKHIAKQAGVEEAILFKGYDDHVIDKLHNYDIGVVCSRAEGFGRVTAEYMMAGLCVIASDTGANPELVKDGECGLLYQYNNTEDLARKLIYVIDHPEICRKMAMAGRKRAEENFTAEINAKNVLAIYKEVVVD